MMNAQETEKREQGEHQIISLNNALKETSLLKRPLSTQELHCIFTDMFPILIALDE